MSSSLFTRRRRLQRGPAHDPRPEDAARRDFAIHYPLSTIHWRRRSRRPAADYTLFLVVLAALGASLALARAVNYGPGTERDSLYYINTAQMLLAGKGFFVNALDAPYTLWPPLYPLALAAAAGLTGLDPFDVAGPLNAALFGLTAFLMGRWLRRRLESRFLAVWAACALALSIPLGDAAAWALSEPLFMLLAAPALIEAEKYLAAGKMRSLLAAAACGALAWQTRYIGAAVPFFVGLLLLCRGRGKQRVRDAAVVWLAAALPMALWMLRNALLVGAFSGPRGALSGYPLPGVLRDIGAMLWRWLYFELPAIGLQPPELLSLRPFPRYDYLKQDMGGLQPPELFSLAGVVWAAAAAAAAGYVLLKFPWKKQTFAAWRPLWVFAGYALTHLALLAASVALEYVDNIVRLRHVTPVYIPLLLAAAFALDRSGRAGCGSPSRRVASRLPAAAVAAALCLWTAGQAAPHARRIVRANAGEQGGNMDRGITAASAFRPQEQSGQDDNREQGSKPRPVESEVLRYVRENPLDGVIYTNQARLPLAMHNRRPAAYYRLPTNAERDALLYADAAAPAGSGQELLEARLAAAPAGAYWVRFEEGAYMDNLLGYGDAWLQSMPILETLADLADGAIYRVRKNAPLRANPYRAALEAAAPPVESGEWRVESGTPSLAGGELVYIKEECTREEARMRFMLHVYPADAADLPAVRKRGGYAFDNLSFYFTEHGVVLEGACVALYPLPDYAIERIETGQYAPGGEGLAWRAALRAAVGGSASRRVTGR